MDKAHVVCPYSNATGITSTSASCLRELRAGFSAHPPGSLAALEQLPRFNQRLQSACKRANNWAMTPPNVPPRTRLETHTVENQPRPFAGRNLYLTDLALREAVRREAGDWLDERASALGPWQAPRRCWRWVKPPTATKPELVSFDRYGRRLDEVRFHPSYHSLMALAMEHRITICPGQWRCRAGTSAMPPCFAIFTQVEAGTMSPST